jgi:DNA-binding transcriptional MerR regulator
MNRARLLTGLSDFRIRHYDRLGLLGDVERAPNRYRIFSQEQFATLARIADLRAAGLGLGEIRALLARDENAVSRHLARRRTELARLVRIVDRLEQALADLEAWRASSHPSPSPAVRPR